MSGKSGTSSSTISVPPEVLARYNAVNARAEDAAKQPFEKYSGEFVAPLNETQKAGIQATSDYSQSAQPYYSEAADATRGSMKDVGPLTQEQIGYYQNPYTQSVVNATQAALGQQFGQQQSQQQAQAIKSGAFGGERAGLQRAQLQGQQGLAAAQAISPLYQQGYQQAVQTAMGQQGVVASDLARQMQGAQQLAGLGAGAQTAALQGAQAQIGAGTLGQQTQQAQDTADYQQYLQERGYPFQIAQFLANIAEGTGALSGSTTTTTQPSSFFSDRRLKHDAEKIGETKDGLPIYSFKYNGDDRTQIGLMAQDVEKKHPEAVGMSGGYKTVDYEKALRPVKKAYGGGLDPNSMGGVVTEPGLFARGGYATAGAVVDPTDLSAILAQQRQSFGPFAVAGPYGQAAGSAPHGASGIVPQQQMHVPKLMTAGAPPKPADSGFQDLYKGYQGLNQIADDMTGKSLTRRFGEKTGLTQSPDAKAELSGGDMAGTSANAMTGSQNPAGGVAPMPMARPDASEMTSMGSIWDRLNPFERGGVVPRQHFEGGGVSVNPYANRDPSESYIDDTIQEEDKSKLPEMLKPGGGGGGKGGGGLGSDIMGAASLIGAGKTLASAGSSLASFLPTLFLADGGVVPRGHFARAGVAELDGQSVPADYSEEADLPAQGAQEAGLVVGDQPSAKVKPVELGDLSPKQQQFLNELSTPESGGKWDVRYGGPGSAGKQFDVSGAHPNVLEPTEDGRRSSAAGRYQFTGSTWKDIAGDAPMLPGYQNAAALKLARQEYAQKTGRDFDADLEEGGFTPEMKKALAGRWTSLGGIGPAAKSNDRRSSPDQEQALGGGKPAGFFDSNKQYILPLLQGLGAMAGSKSRYLGSAILEGLGAGAKAYGEEETRQAGTGLTDAQTVNQFMDASRKALMANPANPSVLMVLTPRGWMTQGQAQRLGLPTIGAPLPAAAGATALRRQGQQQAGMTPVDAGNIDVTSAATPPVPKIKAISDVIPASQNKVQPLSVPGTYYDTQARASAQADAGSSNISAAQSEEVRKDIDRASREASSAKPIMNDLTQNTAALIANPASGTGPFANPRQSVLSMADYASRLFLGKDLPAGFDPSDLQVNKKIASYLAGQQTSAVNQNNLQAFAAALSSAPNSELSPKALANITSMLMVQKSRAERIGEFARVYGEDAEGRLSANVIRQYDRIHGRQMQDEQKDLADFFVKYPKAAQKVASGEVPYNVAAQKFKDLYGRPDMAYHFQNR